MSVATVPTRKPGGQRTAVYIDKTCATCGGTFEVREKMAVKQANCDGCREYRLPAGKHGYCVATRELAPVIEEILARRDDALRKTEGIRPEEPTGTLERLAADIAATLKMSPEAAIRRLYATRNFETRVVGSEFADAVFLADGRLIEQEEIRVFPSMLGTAAEMVEIEAEERGEILPRVEIQEQARARLDWATKEVLALDDAGAL